MKRFLVFYSETYYPDGGFYDFEKDFDSKEEAIAWCRTKDPDDFKYGDFHFIDITEENPKPVSVDYEKTS